MNRKFIKIALITATFISALPLAATVASAQQFDVDQYLLLTQQKLHIHANGAEQTCQIIGYDNPQCAVVKYYVCNHANTDLGNLRVLIYRRLISPRNTVYTDIQNIASQYCLSQQ